MSGTTFFLKNFCPYKEKKRLKKKRKQQGAEYDNGWTRKNLLFLAKITEKDKKKVEKKILAPPVFGIFQNVGFGP